MNLNKNTNLSDDFLQLLLRTLSLEILSANGTNLASLNYFNELSLENKEKLKGIDLRNTNVTDLTPLNFSTCKLKSLRFDRDYDLSTVEYLTKAILIGGQNNGNVSDPRFYGSYGGLSSSSYNTYKSIEKCTFLTNYGNYGDNYNGKTKLELDLSNLPNLNNIWCSELNGTLKLGNSVTKISRIKGGVTDLSKCSNLTIVNIHTSTQPPVIFPVNPNENLYIISGVGRYNTTILTPNACDTLSISFSNQETEVMAQCILVYLLPIPFYEGGNQQ